MMTRPLARSGATGTPAAPQPAPTAEPPTNRFGTAGFADQSPPPPADRAGLTREELRQIVLDLLG